MDSFSEKDTSNLGIELAKKVKPGDIILLDGDLGVGKTVFTKGFGKGLGIKDVINSPTFTILKSYEDGRIPLYHFDVYRIEDISEMDEIGYEDYFYGDGVCMIEWAVNIMELIPENAIRVKIEKDIDKGFDYRKITITGNI